MKLSYEQGYFKLECNAVDGPYINRTGFTKIGSDWVTKDIFVALRFSVHADTPTLFELERQKADTERLLHNSAATDANGFNPPVPDGLSLLPYQKAAVAYIAERKRVLLGDEMGLGKTIEIISFINHEPKIEQVLIVCPAFLKLNWKDELEKWLTRTMSIGIAQSKFWPLSDIVIINYELLKKCMRAIQGRDWDLVVGDEIHYCKNPSAKRSKAFYSIPSKYAIGASGTPIPNRPKEIYPVIAWLDKARFPSARSFKERYGQSRYLDELQMRLRGSCMIRRLKSEVLTNLPPKQRQVIELPNTCAKKEVAVELQEWESRQRDIEQLKTAVEHAKVTHNQEEYKESVKKLKAAQLLMFSELAKLREQTARAKLPYLIEHLTNCINSEGKVVVFAYHRSVIEGLAEAFFGQSVMIYGSTKQHERHDAVNSFQKAPYINLFIGSFMAAGTGITLTASSHVVFAELDWRPSTITQAEDRLHRVGQKDSVLCQHIVFRDSLDCYMAHKIVEKQDAIDRALDNGVT